MTPNSYLSNWSQRPRVFYFNTKNYGSEGGFKTSREHRTFSKLRAGQVAAVFWKTVKLASLKNEKLKISDDVTMKITDGLENKPKNQNSEQPRRSPKPKIRLQSDI